MLNDLAEASPLIGAKVRMQTLSYKKALEVGLVAVYRSVSDHLLHPLVVSEPELKQGIRAVPCLTSGGNVQVG